MRVPVLLLLLVAATVGPPTMASHHKEDDGGSGGDAGQTADTATRLPRYGLYHGNMSTPTDRDWYRIDDGRATPLCAETRIEAKTYSNATLRTLGPKGVREVTVHPREIDEVNKVYRMRAGLVSLGLDATLLGLVPEANPDGETPARPGSYSFTLNAFRAADLAPSSGGALPGPCVAGKLAAGSGHVYSFTAYTGNVVTLTLAHVGDAKLLLELRRPDGSSAGGISSGGLLQREIDQDGTWSIAVIRENGLLTVPLPGSGATSSHLGEEITYLLGFARDPPPTSPCRPTCVS